MTVSRVKTWISGEILTATDLNVEFSNILSNGEDLAWPATKTKDFSNEKIQDAKVLATGSITLRSLEDRFDDIINVKDYGAVGDGVVDDSAAINAAFDELRTRVDATKTPDGIVYAAVLLTPGCRYKAESPINMTGIRGHGWGVIATGAVILGHTSGKAVVDMVNSRWGRIKDLTIFGDATDVPQFGLQIGRKGTENADDHVFGNLSIHGTFSSGCLYNYGSETNLFNHPVLFNIHNGASSYCLIQDGTNDFSMTSDYQTITASPGDAISFNENTFISLDARKSVSGPAMYLRRTGRHRFIGGYAVSVDDAAIVVSSDSQIHRGLYLDIHCEVQPDLKHCVKFTGATTQTIADFTFIDHVPFAKNEIFFADTSVNVTMINVDIRIPDLGLTPSNGMFNPKGQFKVYGGTIYADDGGLLANIDEMNAIIVVDDRANITYSQGTQIVFDQTNRGLMIKGKLEVFDNETGFFVGSDLANRDYCALGDGYLTITDNISNPAVTTGQAKVYVHTDGIPKIKFGSGTIQVVGMKVAVPASAGATGVVGQWAAATGWLYICIATDTWERVAIATW